MIKCVVFDVDGTLIDTGEAILSSLQKVVQEDLGQVLSKEELRFAFGIPGAVTLEKLGVGNIEDSLEKWLKYLNDFKNTIKVFKGVNDCLIKLKAGGTKAGIVTSKTRKEFEDSFTPMGLADFFDYVVCADDTDRHKPDPDPLLKLLEISGYSPRDVIYVGDTIYDKKCAEGAGVKFGLALWGAEDIEGINPEYLLHSPEDIPEIVARFREA